MDFIKEFKAFIMRGNVLDLAIGIVIGAAFNKIVTSFVNDVLMPPIGIVLQGVNFRDLKYELKAAEGEVAAVTINYGMFIQSIIDFLIIGFSVFVIIKVYSATKKKEEPAPATPAPLTKSEELLTEIRDSLKQKSA